MVSPTLRRRIAEQAGFQCGYCRTQERVSGIPLTLEHLIPKAKGGHDDEKNLWLSCRLCNEAKGVANTAPNPENGEITALFNPREQK